MNMSGMELARIKRKVEIAEQDKEADLFPKEEEEEDEEEEPIRFTPAPRNETMIRYHYMSRLGFNPNHASQF